MLGLTRVNHIGLRVGDFETSRDFYAKLGFQYVTGPSGPEPVAIVEHPSGININFILNAVKPAQGDMATNILMDIATKHTGYTHVALEVEDAELTIRQLGELGIALSAEPMTHPTGTSLFIRDPDNNVVEFIEYKGLKNLQD
ncbi:VOC family protein [Moritella sp. F3]|uniref:VOC family protein n=1 Tax=Moritella sp. F3 TaxID=2718882 RepID=UPI0018E16273|nr:VOC family protein [Moritella sp. F3]GIC78479.1 lactoylglutathione lyase [Moritella sp. F1]GIC81340.1 lactoylglutathione lyase [Moritella sp. F3]